MARSIVCVLLAVASLAAAQTATTSDYVGYNVTLEGDEDSVVYSTYDTRPDANVTEPDPDVFLNATVHVGEIDLEVDNLTAKVNLDAQVLNLLSFNAGVDVSIDAVRLLIQNVNAKVLLEARLQNLVLMINDTLSSIDLNPIIATLGQDVGEVLNTTVSGLTSSTSSSSTNEKRGFDLANNVVYSINNYAGNTHTNRVLAQNGDLVDQYLDNDGQPHGSKIIGSYATDMTFNGYETVVTLDGEDVTAREYVYSPYHGISAISLIYFGASGAVVGARVLAESSAGGSSTIEDL